MWKQEPLLDKHMFVFFRAKVELLVCVVRLWKTVITLIERNGRPDTSVGTVWFRPTVWTMVTIAMSMFPVNGFEIISWSGDRVCCVCNGDNIFLWKRVVSGFFEIISR